MMDFDDWWNQNRMSLACTYDAGKTIWDAAQTEQLRGLLSAGDDAFPPQREMNLPQGSEPVVVSAEGN